MNLDKYYPAHPYSATNHLGQIFDTGMIDDRQLDAKIEQLVRGAAIYDIQRHGLGVINDNLFEDNLYSKTMHGLNGAIVKPISEREFRRQIYQLFLPSNNGLGFVHDKIEKAVRSAARKVKKVGKKVAKVVRKVVPVVVAGAAIYFTGGKALPLIKKYSGKIGGKWGAWKETLGKYLDKPPPIKKAKTTQDPRITNMAVNNARTQLAAQGVNVDSPEGQKMLTQYTRYQQSIMAGGRPKTTTNWTKVLLPVAVGGAAVFMMSR